jgi:hypothetical protein
MNKNEEFDVEKKLKKFFNNSCCEHNLVLHS